MFWKRFEKSAERILTLSLAFTSAPQWMRCSAHSWCPVRTATWRGVLHSWRYTTRVLVRNVVLRVQIQCCQRHIENFKNKKDENCFIVVCYKHFCKKSMRMICECYYHCQKVHLVTICLQDLSMYLVSGVEFGSFIEKQLQGRQASTSTGPVHSCGIQLWTYNKETASQNYNVQ